MTQKVDRRAFLGSALGTALGLLTGHQVVRTGSANAEASEDHRSFLPMVGKGPTSELYVVRNIPVPDFAQSRYHPGVETLLALLGQHGLKFYRQEPVAPLSGPNGIIAADDVVLLKVNAQWKHRGCTNSDVVRGLIERILAFPGGFTGEVVIVENGQGRGSLDCNQNYDGDTSVAANAEKPSQTFNYLANTVFAGKPVSAYLLDPIRSKLVGTNDHLTQGYRSINPHPERKNWSISYPCFNTAGGHRVEVARGLWTGTGYASNLKLINLPVLKTHGGCGVTGALKLYYGLLSMHYSSGGYHYGEIGQVLGEMFAHVRAPDLNIMDCIWVSHGKLQGYPPSATSRQDTLIGGLDPVAMDYWASKHILYPVSHDPNHHPDMASQYDDSNLAQYLAQAVSEINACGPIAGKPVTNLEPGIICYQV